MHLCDQHAAHRVEHERHKAQRQDQQRLLQFRKYVRLSSATAMVRPRAAA